MADDDLRALERAARGGDGVALERWTRALERAGADREPARRVAAGVAPEVDVGALPTWATPSGAGARSRSCDVEPLHARPRLAWRCDAPPGGSALIRARPRRGRCVFGGWTAVLVQHRSPRLARAVDPLTGAPLWSVPVELREPRVVCGVLVSHEVRDPSTPAARWSDPPLEGLLVGRDVRTGQVLFSRPDVHEAAVGGGLLVTLEHPPGPRFASTSWAHRAYDWPDPRRAPSASARWTAACEDWRDRARRLWLVGGVVFVESYQAGVRALDVATGSLRWREAAADRLLADDDRLVIAAGRLYDDPRGQGTDWTLRGLDGQARWAGPADLVPLALAEDVVVARPRRPRRPGFDELVLLRRDDGHVRARLERRARSSSVLAAARDVVYEAHMVEGVTALATDGEPLWRVTWRELEAPRARPVGLLPLHRRLVVVLHDGAVVCLRG